MQADPYVSTNAPKIDVGNRILVQYSERKMRMKRTYRILLFLVRRQNQIM